MPAGDDEQVDPPPPTEATRPAPSGGLSPGDDRTFRWEGWRVGDTVPGQIPEHNRRKLFAAVLQDRTRQQPHLFAALRADINACSASRGERLPSTRLNRALAIVRLLWVADALPAIVLLRLRISLRRHHVPLLPQLLHRACMRWAQVCIGENVIIGPGLQLLHGQVVIDGFVSIGAGVRIAPWVTVGLAGGNGLGPAIGDGVFIGSGAKVIGPITVGDRARIGANAVVVHDVPPGVTVVGVPARPVSAHDAGLMEE